MSVIIPMIQETLKGSVTALQKPKTPTVIKEKPPEKAKAEKKEEIKTEEKRKIRKKKVTESTVLTSPLGLTGEAPTKKPTLLGK